MAPQDYDSFRQQLEAQLRADIELLYEAFRTKLRAYEIVCRARGELEAWESRPVSLPPFLPPLLASPEPAPAEAAPVVAEPPAAAPTPAAALPPKSEPSAVYYALLAALDKVAEEFDKHDLLKALGYEPHRATLYRALRNLEEDGWIAVAELGSGRQGTRYRRLASAAAADGSGPLHDPLSVPQETQAEP